MSETVKDGIRTHSLLEYCIKNSITNTDEIVNKMLTSENNDMFVVKQDRADRVGKALVYINNALGEQKDGWIVSEMKVNPDLNLGGSFGVVDVHIGSKEVLEVVDYKDGHTEVSSKDNIQLIMYALGVIDKYKSENYTPALIKLTIIQPKLNDRNLPYINTTTMTLAELMEWQVKLNDKINNEINIETPALFAGSHCRYCPSSGNCIPQLDLLKKELSVDHDLLAETMNKEADQLTDKQLVEIFKASDIINALLSGAKQELMVRLDAGVVEGVKQVRGRGSYSWNLSDDDLKKQLSALKVPATSQYVRKIVSPSQFKSLSWTDRKGSPKRISAIKVKGFVDKFVEKSEGKPTLALDSDDRLDIRIDMTDKFSQVSVVSDNNKTTKE
jgi:hypothetical protein